MCIFFHVGHNSSPLPIIKEMALSSKQAAKILGVSVDSSLAEINKVFRQLARTCHPDLHPGDKQAEAKYRRLNEAFTVLSTIKENARRKRGMEEDILENEFERWIKKLDPQKRKNIKRQIRRHKKKDDA